MPRSVRLAKVKVLVDGKEVTLESANYRLQRKVAGVQIDCPITKGYNANSNAEIGAAGEGQGPSRRQGGHARIGQLSAAAEGGGGADRLPDHQGLQRQQ